MKRIPSSSITLYTSAFILLTVIYIGLSIFFGESFSNGRPVRDPFLLTTSLLASAGLLYAAIRSSNEKWYIHISWLIFAVAYLIDNLSTIFQVLMDITVLHYFPGFLIMVSYTLISIGIALLPSSPRPFAPRPRAYLDTAIFIGVTLLASWLFLVIPFFFFNQPLYDQAFTALTFVMVFSVFDLLIRRRQCSNHRTSTLVSISVALTLLGETLLVLQRGGAPQYVNIAMNICWFCSYAAMGTAGLSLEFLGKDIDEFPKDQGYRFDFLMPATWVGLLFILMVCSHFLPEILPFGVIAAGTAAMLAILLHRLYETLKENARLITEAKKEIDSGRIMQEKFWHDSRHDPLTNLPNRSYLEEHIKKNIDLANETRSVKSALMFLDLDRFKPVNDQYGHDVGDTLLKAVSERLIFCVRPDDFVARLGGDEFALVLNNLQTSKSVYKVAARIMDKMKEPFEIQGNNLISGVSFGICFIQPGFEAAEDVLRDADKAMYKAKKKGRGRYEVSQELEF